VAVELVAGLSVVFTTFTKNVGADVQSASGLSYYGARYLAPWLTRWISPDSAGAVDGLNLYV
jgi:RHS repeat-associated protein